MLTGELADDEPIPDIFIWCRERQYCQEPEKLPLRQRQELRLLAKTEISLEVGQRVAQRKDAERRAREAPPNR